jgi:AbrB family looped-hinge helix DNA binding protein
MAGTRVRAKGQITIPRAIREAAHLHEGDPVEVEIVPEGILIKPQKIVDTTQAWFWDPAWQAGEREVSLDVAAGRVDIYESDEDFLASLDD